MKHNFTSVLFLFWKRVSPVFFTFVLFGASTTAPAQIFQLLSEEKYPHPFNGGGAAPVSGTFAGQMGNWSAFSNNNLSTASVKNFANSFSVPNSAELVNNSNTGPTQSYVQITSPEISLTGIMCTGKIDFFCWIYGEQLSAANATTMLKIELFNGSTWNTVWQKSAAQILSDYGLQTWAQVYILINSSYYVANFKYRLVLSTPAGNTNGTKIRIDDCEVYNYSCSGKASLGNYIWEDVNGNGIQQGNETGFKGMTVELLNSSNTVIKSTVTGDDGAYHFIGLDPGTYKVRFAQPPAGYYMSPNNQGSNNDLDSDPDVSGLVTVTLVADEFNKTIDFGLVPGAPLPVKLLSFSAAYNNNSKTTNLFWKIDSNTDMERFEVERSTDGRNFSLAGIVLPFGNNSTSYQFPDNLSAMNAPVVFYRLVMQEKSGLTKYSNVVVIRRDAPVADYTLQLAPNPATSVSSVRINAGRDGTAFVRMLDMTGKTVWQFTTNVLAGTNTIQLGNLENLRKGFYIVQAQLNDQVWNSKLLLQ